MTGLHAILGIVVIVVNGLAATAGGYFLWRRTDPRRFYSHLVALGQTLLIAQAAVGLLLLSEGRRAPDKLHYLYGAVALGAVLSPWLYAPPDPRRRLIWFSGASLLATVLAVRGYTTGSS